MRYWIVMAGLSMLLAGCATGPAKPVDDPLKVVERKEEPPEPSRRIDKPALPTREDFLSLVDGKVPDEMKNSLEVRNYQFKPSEIEEMPEVRCDVFNLREDKDLTFEIRTVFFREDGSPIDATAWTRASALPRRAYRYRAVAYTPHAKSELVQLRLVKEEPTS